MNRVHPIIPLAAVAVACCLLVSCRRVPSPSHAPGIAAFVDVTVVPMTAHSIFEHQTVIVQDGLIQQMGPAERIAVPPGAQIIDGSHRFLMPGLADLHAHVGLDIQSTGQLAGPPDERILRVFLAHGVTTIRDPAGAASTLQWREAVRARTLQGPRIIVSGHVVQNTPRWGAFTDVVVDPEAGRRVVREQARAGYDFIKVYSFLDAPTYAAIVDEAKRQGLTVQGHIPFGVGLEGVAASGQTAVDHAEELYNTYFEQQPDASRIPEAVRLMAEARISFIPTLTVFRTVVQQWDGQLEVLLARPGVEHVYSLVPATRSLWGPEANPYLHKHRVDPARGWAAFGLMKTLVLAMHRGGVPILAGSDAPVPVVRPGYSLHEELELLHEAGLTRFEALAAATRNAARFLKTNAGTVEKGRVADLLLVDGNPLEDLRHAHAIAGVMAAGRWYSKAELEAFLTDIEARPGGSRDARSR